ncbi:hypothetical protein YK48G_04030 [Lentilactobacillus fungorum]|uniref:Beta-1,6-galactofuranosyltransferase n=1 Tax=Lentilactobacillus fungorum TaxID=2201250 RepID=A0ABQ3VVR8_9LACO|nr:hypothetical protein [Lentilactobacillus fungorum]GHP12978.1 hypothetical protein YK48G_04030 [Lentilactobacillus fungorum]
MNYVVEPINNFAWDATVKPRYDVAAFLVSVGWRRLKLPMFYRLSQAEARQYIRQAVSQFKPGDVVLWQTPTYNSYWPYESEFVKAAHTYGVKVIALVHDVDVLRGLGAEVGSLPEFLNQFDCLINLSSRLNKLLAEWGVNVPMVTRGPWDYLVKGPVTGTKLFTKNVYYTGNLTVKKSHFLDELPSNVQLKVYGDKPAERSFKPNLEWLGTAQPDHLPSRLNDGFGLVWDGEINPLSANKYGTYLAYNWSHKLSAYLAAGIPVIVWRQSHAAKFVTSNGLGLAIDNLNELAPALAKVTQRQYQGYLDHIQPFSQRIREGFYIIQATSEALLKLGNGASASTSASSSTSVKASARQSWVAKLINWLKHLFRKGN